MEAKTNGLGTIPLWQTVGGGRWVRSQTRKSDTSTFADELERVNTKLRNIRAWIEKTPTALLVSGFVAGVAIGVLLRR